MWIPQQISCGIHMIMGRGAAPPDNPGQNGRARHGAKAGTALVNGIARDVPREASGISVVGNVYLADDGGRKP